MSFKVEEPGNTPEAIIDARSVGEAIEYYLATHGRPSYELIIYEDTDEKPTEWVNERKAVVELMGDLSEQDLQNLDLHHSGAMEVTRSVRGDRVLHLPISDSEHLLISARDWERKREKIMDGYPDQPWELISQIF